VWTTRRKQNERARCGTMPIVSKAFAFRRVSHDPTSSALVVGTSPPPTQRRLREGRLNDPASDDWVAFWRLLFGSAIEQRLLDFKTQVDVLVQLTYHRAAQ